MDKEFDRPDIKIIRFKDGIDVICRCIFDKKDYAYDLHEPMMFDITNKGQLVLQHWLPLSVMKVHFVRIKEEDILCVYEPNPQFAEYYHNMIDRMNSVIDSSKEEEIDTEEMIQVLEDLDTKGVYIH